MRYMFSRYMTAEVPAHANTSQKGSWRRVHAVLFLLISFVLSCPAAGYFFRTVNATDGLADNFVRDIVRDSRGYIWFSTIYGVSRYDGYRFRNYQPMEFGGRATDVTMVRETADSTLWMICGVEPFTFNRDDGQWQKNGEEVLARLGVKGELKMFYVDDRHNLWAATDNGLFHYDYAQSKLQRYNGALRSAVTHIAAKNGLAVVVTADGTIYEATQGGQLTVLTQAPGETHDRDSHIYLDNHGHLWFYQSHAPAGTQWLFSTDSRQWRQLTEWKQMAGVLVNALTEAADGSLWVGTGNAGVMVLEWRVAGSEMTLVKAENAMLMPFVPRSSHVSCLYLDNMNTMWVGSAKLGAAFTDMSSPGFNIVPTGDREDVSALVEDREGNLWLAFDGGGIMMQGKNGVKRLFTAAQEQLPSDIVTSLAILDDGTLIAGTYGSGMARYDGKGFRPVYENCPNLKYIKAMTSDIKGNLWVATVDKGVVRVGADGKIFSYTPENSPLASSGTLCLCTNNARNIIYIGTSMGVSAYDCSKGQFLENEKTAQLKGAYVSSILVCNHDRLWMGSRNGLWVYDPHDGTVRHITTDEGMSHNIVRALAKSGNSVWASTDNGLTLITCQKAENGGSWTYQCHPFLDSDGLRNVIFSNDAAWTTSDGTTLLGCFRGYVSIPPENFVAHYPKLRVQFTELRINGDLVDGSSITIRHNDRMGIAVSAMAPALSQKIKYLYRFKGEEKWLNAPSNILYFASLKPGNYVLQVKALLPGMAESDIAEISIRVKPPVLLSNVAIVAYLLLIAAAIFFIIKGLRKRQKRELAMQQMEVNLKKYEMEEEKIRFFTNISHDLKTPLTLVVAPLEKLRENPFPPHIRTELDVAWRNARQLYDLILQLLDFRRLDVGKEKLNLKHGDIVGFVRQTVQEFSYYAMNKHIKKELRLPPDSIEIYFDENKMHRIIKNLLSNAFKYNTDNGTVVVTLSVSQEAQGGKMVLSVADTGIGVHNKQHIFERFVQESHGQEQEGSGLGLHIVKQYVDMMKGSIDVSDNSPQGTVFTVTLPLLESDGEEEQVETMADLEKVESEQAPKAVHDERPTILVVDDNMDARLFLQRSLDDEYQVLVAANGKEALEVLDDNDNISIVVSDVMMPVMDGIELFRRIKSNISYSHIPVIMLTAKSSEENIVAGLQEGAADYITKPFSLAVLRLRIKRILEWMEKAHTKVAEGVEIEPTEITVSSLDKELISHVIENIEANIHDVNYSVVQLSSDVGMTRGHLYKKLMAITGKAPLEFIRIIKIKRGKSLLDQGKTNITEVADMVGFSPKQFGHYFKQMYNDTPSDYLRKQRFKKSDNLSEE